MNELAENPNNCVAEYRPTNLRPGKLERYYVNFSSYGCGVMKNMKLPINRCSRLNAIEGHFTLPNRGETDSRRDFEPEPDRFQGIKKGENLPNARETKSR
jgi:hypothetical protein